MNKKNADTRWRMAFHLMPPTGWLNDPNGLCQFKGTYHVFHQYSPEWPEGKERGWGHFTSPDLVHWEHHGMVIHQDIPEDASGAYSGGALVERDAEGRDTLLRLYYTGNVKEPGDYDYVRTGRQANQIEVTSEDGSTLSPKRVLLRNADYPDFLSCHVRDPKLWREDSAEGSYHMLLGARDLEDHGRLLLFDSVDGERWTYRSCPTSEEPFGYMWECPDRVVLGGWEYAGFSPQGLPCEEWRWQNVSNCGYIELPEGVHLLDADRLDQDDFVEWDRGFDFYAPQTFVDESGRTILIGWMASPDVDYESAPEGLGWIHCLTVPRELSRADDGRILQLPVAELATLREDGRELDPRGTATLPRHRADVELAGVTGNLRLTLDDALELVCEDGAARLRFLDKAVGAGRTERRVRLDAVESLRVLVDESGVEVYLNGGREVFSTRWFPVRPNLDIALACDCATARAWTMRDTMSNTYAH